MFTCTKKFGEFPFAHRQHCHEGHCALLHGHSWSFTITFGARERDANGFIIDFGQLKDLRAVLQERFDHTLVVNEQDPALGIFRELEENALCRLTIVPGGSAEDLAEYVWHLAAAFVQARYHGRVSVIEVICHEGENNWATYRSVSANV